MIKANNERATRTSNTNHCPITDVEILFLNLKDTKVINAETRIMADEKFFKLEVCHVEAGQTDAKEFQLTDKIMGMIHNK